MKSYNEILNDLQTIQDELKLQGEAVELNKRLAAYVFYHWQIDVVNAIREGSINTAYLMNSKIVGCMDNMYSVFRGNNPILKLNMIFNAEFGAGKFDLVYTSNTFKLYAKDVISQQPTLADTAGNKTPVELELIMSKSDKIVYCPKDDQKLLEDKKWPYYIDIKLPTNLLASNLSEHLFIYRVDEEGNKIEVKWTRIFTEHASSLTEEELLFVLTIPDYGLRVYKKGYFSLTADQNLYFEVLPFTTTEDINLLDVKKVSIPEGVLKSQKGYPQDQLPDPNDTTELEQVVNIDDSGNLILTVADRDYYQMYLSPEITRQDAATLSYQANFSGKSSSSIISNNDILFLFSETFIDRILSCNFSMNVEANAIYIYYVANTNAAAITPSEKTEFINKYDKYGLASSMLSIQEGNRVTRTVTLEYVPDGVTDISEQAGEIIEFYNNKLGQTLNPRELEGKINKLTGVNYVNSLQVSGLTDGQIEQLDVSQYYDLSLILKQVLE